MFRRVIIGSQPLPAMGHHRADSRPDRQNPRPGDRPLPIHQALRNNGRSSCEWQCTNVCAHMRQCHCKPATSTATATSAVATAKFKTVATATAKGN